MTVNYKDIGERIRKLRLEKGWSQRRLADKIDMTTTHISHIENGTTKLGLPTIIEIANVLNTTVDHILCDSIVQSGAEHTHEFSQFLSGCTPLEIRYLTEISRAALAALRHVEDSKKNLMGESDC